MSKLFLASLSFVSLAALAWAADPAPSENKALTSATYAITGLHCPPCTKVVEGSLSKAPGVRTVKVDWGTKLAKIEFDEAVTPASRIADLIAATPHLMGPSLHYGGWLTLKAADVKDEATAQAAKKALAKVAGVQEAAAFPDKHLVEVRFASAGKVTSSQLIAALAAAGIKAENF